MPTISIRLQKEGYLLAKTSTIKKKKLKGDAYYFFNTENNTENITENEMDEHIKKQRFNFSSFNEYKQFRQKFYIVHDVQEQANVYTSICNCKIFLKTYICCHIIAVGLINATYKIDNNTILAIQDDKLTKKPKMSSKMTRALIID